MNNINQKIINSAIKKCFFDEYKSYGFLFRSSIDAIFIFSMDYNHKPIKLVEVNDSACRTLGYEKSELINLSISDIDGGPVTGHTDTYEYSFENLNHVIFDRYLKSKCGVKIPYEISMHYSSFNGKWYGLAIGRNLTSRMCNLSKNSKGEEIYKNIVELSPDAILIYCDEKIVYSNASAVRLLNLAETDEIVGESYLKFIDGSMHEPIKRQLELVINHKTTISTLEKRLKLSSGNEVDVNIAASYIQYDENPAVQIVIRDITESKWNRLMVDYMKYYDTLTGLINRTLFIEEIVKKISISTSNGRFAVIYIDIDQFKLINDTIGHKAGDMILVEFSKRLCKVIENKGVAARTGGDEFGLIINSYNDKKEIENLILALTEQMKQPFFTEEYELYINISMGVSLYPENGCNADKIIKNADIAMYRAKGLGGNTYQFYVSSMSTKTDNYVKLSSNLKKSIERNELVLHFQPQYNISTGRIEGAEALVRWQHPVLGLVPPSEFISIAEDSGFIHHLGEWVIRNACKYSKQWNKDGLPSFRVAVNISTKQFLKSDLFEAICNILDETGFNPSNLELEITESSFINNVEHVNSTLNKLRSLGIKIAMDDFGTGYSSLSCLKKINIDILKVDKSFINDMTQDKGSMAIVTAIVNMAHALGLKVVAEGVETFEQLLALKSMDCDFVQGYLMCKPLNPIDFEKMLFEKGFFMGL
ncbi:MAG: sensor domain-containing protein [Bacillota bacterium]